MVTAVLPPFRRIHWLWLLFLAIGAYVWHPSSSTPLPPTTRSLAASESLLPRLPRTRILYIVTSLAEYNSGTRSTVRGSDRLQETLIPVVSHNVRSWRNRGYHVDLYLICHYTLQPERLQLIQNALPDDVQVRVWNDATPLGYDTGKEFVKLQNRTLHLARQHRFVLKDLLLEYDHFCNFEDDMILSGDTIDHYRAVSMELRRLRAEAPDEIPGVSARDASNSYHGVLTKGQLKRMIPGFIRVEVLLDEAKYGAQTSTGPVPIDLEFEDHQQRQVNPQACCHVHNETANHHIPLAPTSDQLMLWETNIFPLGIRRMPNSSWLDWVVLQRGPAQNKLPANETIGDYWSNRHGDYWNKTKRPAPGEFKYINNMGGWMATREQLWEWHTEICPGGFLPPYEAPHYRYDGLDMRNVEWYSGGMQLSTLRHACNMQRIIVLEPEGFSKSLLYHSANNKQRQLAGEGKREWFTKANTLLGQLNTIKKRAEGDMKDEASTNA